MEMEKRLAFQFKEVSAFKLAGERGKNEEICSEKYSLKMSFIEMY